MITKTKIGVISLILASFIAGGFVFSAGQVNASENDQMPTEGGHMMGFFRGGCDLNGLEKCSPEWHEKMEECKAEREVKIEERKAQIAEFKTMTPEERQAKKEEIKAKRLGDGEQKGRGLKSGYFMKLSGFKI